MRFLIAFFLVVVVVQANWTSVVFDGAMEKRVVYGVDGREDARLNYLNMSLGVAGMFLKRDVQQQPDGVWVPRMGRYTRGTSACGTRGLCTTEKFYGEPTGPWCTAFLLTPTLLASAGHCTGDPALLRFVFDFDTPNPVVRDCSSVRRAVNTRSEDYALFELDRPVTDRHIFEMAPAAPRVGERLILLGHPMGLPIKADDGGSVKAVSTTLIAADIDAYAGNSGSPVISQESKKVVGILVKGNADYKIVSNCCTSNTCSSTSGCGGTFELATRISRVSPYV